MSKVNPKALQAQRLLEMGRVEDAETLLQSALKSSPTDASAMRVLSLLMYQRRRFYEASQLAQDAVRYAPDDAASHANLARIMGLLGRQPQAIAASRRALELDPSDIAVRTDLVNRLSFTHKVADAVALCMEGLEHSPNDASLMLALGRALLASAQATQAIDVLKRAAALHPKRTDILEALAFSSNYAPDMDPAEVRGFHEQHASALRASVKPLVLPPSKFNGDPDRRLRVGLMSPDFWSHAVGRFIEPLLQSYDREQLDIVCYHTDPIEDHVTARFEGLVSAFRRVAAFGPRDLVRQIREDRIDILIELTGLTASHRLPVMLYHAAPVQVTYLGYPNTTGASEVGYRIVDSHTDPVPSADAHAAETLVRLDPCFLCYQAPTDVPTIDRSSATRGDSITFGSFNDLKKLSEPLLALWTRILHEVPSSKLVIKTMPFAEEQARESVSKRLIALGVDLARVELRGPAPDSVGHLHAYRDIDIALDTFPYHGTTTTCEALLMGVPVVTLAGHVHASRVGVSLLNAVGAPELIAESPDMYVRLASELANDRTRLNVYHENLRERLLGSALCDQVGYARRFEAMIRELWRTHLAERERGNSRR